METSNKNQKIVLFVFNTEIMTKSKNRVKNYVKLYKKNKNNIIQTHPKLHTNNPIKCKNTKIHILKQNTQKQQKTDKNTKQLFFNCKYKQKTKKNRKTYKNYKFSFYV